MSNQSTGIKYLRLGSLSEWPQNYRRGDVDAIVRSIRRFGFNGALRVRGKTVIAGNHALRALNLMQEAGDTAPVGVRVQGPHWLVPSISVDHLSDDEATAFAIADNRTQELGDNDDEQLRNLLRGLAVDADLVEASGFSDDDLKLLLGSAAADEAPPATFKDVDKFPTNTKCPKCGFEWEAA